VTPSAVLANLQQPEVVVVALRTALQALAAAGDEVSLLVPDLTARIAVLDFDALPGRREEIEAVARFRLRKSLPFAEAQAVISCQVLSSTRLLVALADRARLDEYEDCLEAAGARASLVLPSGLAALASHAVLDHGGLLLRAEPGCLTTAFCWQGRVEFYRVLELSGAPVFDDVFPSVAYFRDRVEREAGHESGHWLLYSAGLEEGLNARLREEAPWAEWRSPEPPSVAAAGAAPTAGDMLAVTGALRGRFS
ncbi:MAG: hypothetical protein ACRD1A_14035, partial [Terriglobales bacterium]